jgi:hypothetical protein
VPGSLPEADDGPRGAEARFALEQAWAALSAQRGDLADLQSRAKDVLGFLTLAGSFLGAFGVAGPDGVRSALADAPVAQATLLALLPAVTVVVCLYVLVPSTGWRFAVDSRSVAQSLASRPEDVGFDDVAGVHLFYAESLRRLVDGNMTRLRRRMWALWVGIGGLAATTVLVVVLLVT